MLIITKIFFLFPVYSQSIVMTVYHYPNTSYLLDILPIAGVLEIWDRLFAKYSNGAHDKLCHFTTVKGAPEHSQVK